MYACSKWDCEEGHYHINSVQDSPCEVGSHLWAAAGNASIEEMLRDCTMEEVVACTAKFLSSPENDGGMTLIDDYNSEEVDMNTYIQAYLESESEYR